MSLFRLDPRDDVDSFMDDNYSLFTSSYESRIDDLESNIKYSIVVNKEASKQHYENIMSISDVFGNVNMIQIDLLTVGYYLLYEKRVLPKMYFARQLALLIYEELKSFERFRGTFRKALKQNDNDSFIDSLKKQSEENKNKAIKFDARYKDYLGKIRHATIAHRNPYFEKQINIMMETDPYVIFGLSMKFELIINDLNDILKSYLSRFVVGSVNL